MFRPEDFAELLLRLRPLLRLRAIALALRVGLALRATPAAPNRKGNIFLHGASTPPRRGGEYVPYLLQPFLVSSNPSNKRPALAPASVSNRCGWPFSTV